MRRLNIGLRPELWCILVGLLSFWAHAGIVVNDQQRELHIEGQSKWTLGVSPPVGNPFSDTQTAAAFAPFNQTISDSSIAPPPPPPPQLQPLPTTASASQNSTLASDGQSLQLVASGSAIADAGQSSTAQTVSSYYVVFTLDAPATYSLKETVADPELGTVVDIGAQLFSGTQPPPYPLAGGPTATSIIPAIQFDPFATPHFFMGLLQPGTYTLEGQGFGGPFDEAVEADFSVNFSLTTSGAASVPLPNAASMGMMALAIMVGGGLVRRRFARGGQ